MRERERERIIDGEYNKKSWALDTKNEIERER
jgi:hypothetical protein